MDICGSYFAISLTGRREYMMTLILVTLLPVKNYLAILFCLILFYNIARSCLASNLSMLKWN